MFLMNVDAASPSSLPPFEVEHLNKLKSLSILSLAASTKVGEFSMDVVTVESYHHML